ncbi:methyltransferase-like protein 17, mitochondrial isoform X2 [Formica exsecta]|uniref:methyltransferase-like protein 17, mitochondrial isoform X2 n=1 Tax=Formica exsecta TaxID=72781 RepID=UPI001141EDA8|nr:methyltransferase-like protein 17, mitochondrial isoform X2 [Formica exsecta]
MVKLIVSKMQCTRIISSRYFSAKPKALLDDATSISFANNEIKYRHHPGIIKPRTSTFPVWASKEIQTILKEKNINLKEINESAKKLCQYLTQRYPQLEQSELLTRLQKVEKRLNANNHDEKISVKDIDFNRNMKARNILKEHVYHWQPINFDKLTCLTYLVAKSVQNHAVSHKILNEIKIRDKDFRPETFFDFGSGIGTNTWAASEIWSDSLKEYFCVETSESMIELSERLAEVAKPKIKETFYRQFFPASMNLPSQQFRLETILKLWKKTEKYLIIVEEGTNAGFTLVNEARDFILRYANSKYRKESQFVHVFSPCPHDLKCPRLIDNTPCNFSVLYHPLQFLGSKGHKSQLYSYVVLKKDKRPENDEQWPKIVRPVLKRSNHVICRMCLANGELKEDIFTKYKHGKHMYRCAKSSEWGDRLPLNYEQQQESPEEDGISNETTTTIE